VLGFQRGDLRVQGVQGEHRMLRVGLSRVGCGRPVTSRSLPTTFASTTATWATTGGVGTGVLLGGSVVVVGFGGAVGWWI
jgi:hypothetical protein